MEGFSKDINHVSLNTYPFTSSSSTSSSSPRTSKTMEDFWKDINHVPLSIHPFTASSSSSSSFGSSFHSLKKLHEFLAQPLRFGSCSTSIVHSTSINVASHHTLPNSSASLLPSVTRKRLPESDHDRSSSGDRRSKRMIKNRESAARSRARKQAYTNELELTLKQLKEENARLMRQLQQIHEAPAANKEKMKKPPYRAFTAPF